MYSKHHLHTKAILLRRQGMTYSEIRAIIPVAKSTLSLWFHDVGLAEYQKQRITEKRIAGQKNAVQSRRVQRASLQKSLWLNSGAEIGQLSKRELWLIGVALYWGEGTKEKTWRTGTQCVFSNSDPRMIQVYLAWLRVCVEVLKDDIFFEIYVHKNKLSNVENIKIFWSNTTGFPVSFFQRVYLKKNKINSKRKNTDFLYNGLLRVKIRKSSTLVRKIEGWTRGIVIHCRVV